MSELPSWVPSLDRPHSITRLRILIGLVVVLSLLTFVVRGADNPPDPYLAGSRPIPLGPPIAAAPRVRLDGFGETRITVQPAAGGLLSWCMLLASTNEQRLRGLMAVTDPLLGGYDGMVFRYEQPDSGGYWMRNTPMPLSIVYVGVDGRVAGGYDMAPCEDSPSCQVYPDPGQYIMAIEVPQERGLARLGIDANALVVDDKLPCS